MCWFYALLIALIVGIILIIAPKFIYTIDYCSKYKNSIYKYFHNLLLILESAVGISFCVQILYSLFFTDINCYMAILGISIVIGLVSSDKPSDIIQLSTLFNILTIFLIIFGFIYFIPIDFSLIFPFNTGSIYPIIFSSGLIICNNLNLLLMDKDNFNISKFKVVFPILMAIIFFSFELFSIIITMGDRLLSNIPWIGFVILSIKPVAKYVGNFDFAYIILIIVFSVFKFGFNLSIIRSSYKKTHNALIMLIVGILGIVAYKLLPYNDKTYWIISIVILLEGLLIIWLIKEGIYDRKTKE